MAKASTSTKKTPVEKFKHDQEMGARREILEELFNDFYRSRRSIFLMNFIRGIFFGLGSAIGGTVMVALIIWILSFFVNFPWIGDAVQNTQQNFENSQRR